ncbi:MAG: OmpA family protein, partial [Candidatus Wenzhouxiangella sp. M2_3B_020]
ARLDYVGDDWRVGVGLSDEGDVVAELLGVLALGERDSWVAEGWFQDGAGGVKLNYHWLPGKGDPAQQEDLPGVWKLYLAADQNRHDDRKLSLGTGYEKRDLFWSTQFSVGLTDERLVDDFTDVFEEFVFGTDASGRPFRQLQTTSVLTETFEEAYDYGVGLRVGRFFDQPNVRLQGGLDYEWGDFDSDQVTLSGTAEKFFTGTGHSLALSVARFEKSGDFEQADADTRATLIWRYAFGRSYRPRVTAEAVAAPAPAPAATETQARRAEETTTRIVRSNVEMESDAFFAFDSAEIRPDAREKLQGVADLITSGRIVGRVSVVGHTCDIGPEAYNQRLSNRRAESVKRELVALGVDPNAIVTDGRGESDPLVPNTSEENRELNRRVDVEFIRVVEEEEVVRVER